MDALQLQSECLARTQMRWEWAFQHMPCCRYSLENVLWRPGFAIKHSEVEKAQEFRVYYGQSQPYSIFAAAFLLRSLVSESLTAAANPS